MERYKRHLFSARHGTRTRPLKDEMHRLLSGSKELVEFASSAAPLHAAAAAMLPGAGSHLVLGAVGSAGGSCGAIGGGGASCGALCGCVGASESIGSRANSAGSHAGRSLLPSLGIDAAGAGASTQTGVSYERLQQMIENVLADTGYYETQTPHSPAQPFQLAPGAQGLRHAEDRRDDGRERSDSVTTEGEFMSSAFSSSAPEMGFAGNGHGRHSGAATPNGNPSASPRLGPRPVRFASQPLSSSLAVNPVARRAGSRLPKPSPPLG